MITIIVIIITTRNQSDMQVKLGEYPTRCSASFSASGNQNKRLNPKTSFHDSFHSTPEKKI